MEQRALFLALKQICEGLPGQVFKLFYNDMDGNKGFNCGIYVSGERAGQYRDLNTGQYINRFARVQFLAQGDDSHNGNLETSAFCGYLRNVLSGTVSKSFMVLGLAFDAGGFLIQDVDGSVVVEIIKTDVTQDVVPLGKTSQGKARYSLNALITYTVQEGV
jgi:hypothetical protein